MYFGLVMDLAYGGVFVARASAHVVHGANTLVIQLVIVTDYVLGNVLLNFTGYPDGWMSVK